MGVFLYATVFGATSVFAFMKMKKKEVETSTNRVDLVSMKLNIHRFYKSRDVQAANTAYQTYLAALEELVAANVKSYEDELHNVRLEYSLFKRKNRIANTTESEQEVEREVTPELRKISRLLEKEAALYMENDPNTSLDLLHSAACFDPDKSLQPEIKIANINFKLGKNDEAYATYERILQTMDRGDLKNFHTKSQEICEKILVKKYKDEQYQDYLYFYCKWLYHTVVLLALNGKVNDVNMVLGANDKLSYGVPTKINNCLSRLGKTSKKQSLNDAMNLYFDKHGEHLKQIAQCASKQNNKNSATQANLLANDLTTENFEYYYQNRIKLTLE